LDAIAEIPGAGRLLRELEAEPDVFIAFATGSLRSMAEVKLGLLGVDAATAVLATGSDYITREEIVEAVIEQTRARAGRDLKVVMLGDGIWDERTAVKLGIPFVALETGTHTFSEVPVLKLRDFTALAVADLIALAQPVSATVGA
jgi:phosphoglycolate phosphatase-like HAD superfamily hydrolase